MANCKGCGREIVWAVVVDGFGKPVLNAAGQPTRVPLDPSAPVYLLQRPRGGEACAQRFHECMVSHFSTCSEANRFSGKNKERKGVTR